MLLIVPSIVSSRTLKGAVIFCLCLFAHAKCFSGDTTVVRGVLLDPGHGGEPEEVASSAGEKYSRLSYGAKQGYREECYGAINEAGYMEKEATLAVAKKVKKYLEKYDIPVAMTRNDDSYVGLNERVATAMDPEYKNWLFVSIHFNRSSSQQQAVNLSEKYQAPRGFEIYVLPGKGKRSSNGTRAPSGYLTVNQTRSANRTLAEKIEDKLTSISGVRSRGIKEAWFVVLRGSPNPSVLIEAGFMSNPEEGRLIATSEYQDKLAKAIVEGILEYKGESVAQNKSDKKQIAFVENPPMLLSKERTSATFE